MTAYAYASPNEKAISGALTLLMHGLFFALLLFGVAWQKREPPAMVVDLWSSLPPPPKAEPVPAPPKPAPKAVAKPVAKPEPKPIPKADIELREKKAKERELAEKKKRELAEKRERELAEKKKREEQARLERLKQAKEAEAQRLAREQEEALQKIAAEKAAAQSRIIDEYLRRIHDTIKARIINAGCISLKNPEIHLQLIILPEGNVLDEPKIRKSSGASTCDAAVVRAVLLAQPLPLPPDPALFPKFRELNLQFRPND